MADNERAVLTRVDGPAKPDRRGRGPERPGRAQASGRHAAKGSGTQDKQCARGADEVDSRLGQEGPREVVIGVVSEAGQRGCGEQGRHTRCGCE